MSENTYAQKAIGKEIDSLNNTDRSEECCRMYLVALFSIISMPL